MLLKYHDVGYKTSAAMRTFFTNLRVLLTVAVTLTSHLPLINTWYLIEEFMKDSVLDIDDKYKTRRVLLILM